MNSSTNYCIAWLRHSPLAHDGEIGVFCFHGHKYGHMKNKKSNSVYSNIFIGTPLKGNRNKYQNDDIFQSIDEIKDFYAFLANHDDTVTVAVAKGPINFNRDIFLSLSNTLDSIKQLFGLGRANDAISLIRKFNDAVLIHTYALIVSEKEEQVFFEENHSLYDNIVNDWVNGENPLVEKNTSKKNLYLSVIKNKDTALGRLLFDRKKQKDYGRKRSICNDNVHYNYWNTFQLNNDSIMDYPISLDLLSEAHDTIRLLFVIHFAYLILLKPIAMLSCDYIYALDEGLRPDEESMSHAASIVCEMFEKYIVTFDISLAKYLNKCTFLELEY